jgi:hypothetical protein
MSIMPVNKPEASKSSGMGQLSTILRMIPTPWTQGAATVLQVGQAAQDSQASAPAPSAEPVQSSGFDNGAMGRRREMMAVDHGTELKSALSAIDSSDWDAERKKQLRAPIEQALYKGGYA